MESLHTRRVFLGLCGSAALAAATPAIALSTFVQAKVSTDDTQAKALGYVEDASRLKSSQEAAFKPGTDCGNCRLYAGAQEKSGYAPCGAFSGRLVARKGWCRAYTGAS